MGKASRFGSDVEADKHVGLPMSIAHEGSTYFHIKGAFIDSSSGAGDAGKPIKLNASGKVDSSMYEGGESDHGNLTGLEDDDHTQYLLADGSRALAGDWLVGGYKLNFDAGGTYYLRYEGNRVLCMCHDYFQVKPSGDDYGLILRDSGSSAWGSIKQVDGVSYIGDGETTLANMIAISGTQVTFPAKLKATKFEGLTSNKEYKISTSYDLLLCTRTSEDWLYVRNQADSAYKGVAAQHCWAEQDPIADNYGCRKSYVDTEVLKRGKLVWKSSPNTLSLTADNTWRTYDFTSLTSANTLFVLLSIEMWGDGTRWQKHRWRKYGLSHDFCNFCGFETPSGQDCHHGVQFLQAVDTAERAQYKIQKSAYGGFTVKLVGYIEQT